jgi:hypothetical protein
MTLLIHPAGGASFTLYEDDGMTNAYAAGGHVQTEFTCAEDPAGCVVTIGRPQGNAGLIPRSRSYMLQILCPHPPRSVTLDGAALPQARDMAPGWWHDGERFLFVRLGGEVARVRIETQGL